MSSNAEERLGQLMLASARGEGHSARMPVNERPKIRARRVTNTDAILGYFTEKPAPVRRSELSKILNIDADPLRRLCRTLVHQGVLLSKRTHDGVIYTPSPDAFADASPG